MQQERELSIAQDEDDAVDRRQKLEDPKNGDRKKHAAKTPKKGKGRKSLADNKGPKQAAKKAETKKKSKNGPRKASNEKKKNQKKNKGRRGNGKNGGFLDFLCSFLTAIPGLSSILSLLPTSIIEQVHLLLLCNRVAY